MITVFPLTVQTPTNVLLKKAENNKFFPLIEPKRRSMRPYYYNSSGEICGNPLLPQFSSNTPKSGLRYRPLGTKLEASTSIQKSKAKVCLSYTQEPACLNSTLTSKEIFVVEDGSSNSSPKLQGFYYNILRVPMNRREKEKNLEEFFTLCRQELNRHKKFKVLFTLSGKMLNFLQDVPYTEKILIVSQDTSFVGLEGQGEGVINKEIEGKIPLKPNGYSHVQVRPSTNKTSRSLINQSANTRMNLNQLKIKLGQTAVKIDNELPKLFNLGMHKLKSNYRFTEAELHKLYAKYKMLVHLSIAKNPNHNIFSGISKDVFVESYQGSPELIFVLGRIFDCFDTNRSGTIDWEEYLYAMDITCNGDYREQIDLFFQVYDQDMNGKLSFEEIKELCKLQLQKSDADNVIDELAQSFASLIFDMTETPQTQEIPADRIKEVLGSQGDKSLIEMFCSFSFMRPKHG